MLTMRKAILSVCVALALLTMAPSVLADDLAGLSGECYDEEGNGGKAHIAVSEEGEVTHEGIVNEDDPTDLEGGVVDAVATFALGIPGSAGNDDQDACTAPTNEEDPDREGKDYLEVHVLGFQVCYDGDANVETGPEDWACDTRPTGLP